MWKNKLVMNNTQPIVNNDKNFVSPIKESLVKKQLSVSISNDNWTIDGEKKFTVKEGWRTVNKNSTEWLDFCSNNYHIKYKMKFNEARNVQKLAIELISKGVTEEESLIRYFMIGSYCKTNYVHVCGNKCANCGKQFVTLTNEHILAISLCGGTDFNMCILCFDCNQSKANKFIRECYDQQKLHPRFVSQLDNINIDCSKLSDQDLLFTLCKLASSYRNKCMAIYQDVLSKSP